MNKIGLLILGGMFMVAAVGCGTIKGLGQDVSAVGGWFVKSSDKVKEGSISK